MRALRPSALVVLAVASCGSDPPPAAGCETEGSCRPASCLPGEALVGAACIAAGLSSDRRCPPGEIELTDGGCQPPGVTEQGCAPGFVYDGDGGCRAVLPATPCPPGSIAQIGEAACSEVASCGSGSWGDIPVDAGTVYVDAAYSGPISDGSAQNPFRTIGEGYAAALPGAIVAVAGGSYTEDLVIGKPVALWGRCPSMVEIVGSDQAPGAVVVQGGAVGTSLRNMAVTGARIGVMVPAATGVLIERLWVHDTGGRGIDVESSLGAAEVTVRDSLVEGCAEAQVIVLGAVLEMQRTVLRNGSMSAPLVGRGLHATSYGGTSATVTLTGVALLDVREAAIVTDSSDLSADGCLIRDVHPNAQGSFGIGVVVTNDNGPRGRGTITRSTMERARGYGVFARGADVELRDVLIDDTLSGVGPLDPGSALRAERGNGSESQALIQSSTLQDNGGITVVVVGSVLEMTSTIVRRTRVHTDGSVGWGLLVSGTVPGGDPSSATLHGVRAEANPDVGILVTGSDATLDSVHVLDSSGPEGRGLDVEMTPTTQVVGTAIATHMLVERSGEVGAFASGGVLTLQACALDGGEPPSARGIAAQFDAQLIATSVLVERSMGFGVLGWGATVELDSIVVRDSRRDAEGRYGDGVTVAHTGIAPASAVVAASVIDQSHRAAAASFGATLVLADNALTCQSFDLGAEPNQGHAFDVHDDGGNACGCPVADQSCRLASVGLEPPEPP